MPSFLSVLVSGLALTLSLALPAGAETIHLRYANFPPANTLPCVQMERWIDEAQKATQGRLHIDSFPAGALLDARSMLRGVIRGQADIGCFSTAYYSGAFPLTSVFELPLGYRSAEEATRALMAFIQEQHPEDLSKIKILLAFTTAPSQVMSRTPLANLSDLQGLRLRASGMLADEVSLLGGKPVSMPQSETPDALQRGAVDGVFTSMDVLKDLNYAENCRFGLLTDMSVYPFLVVMNLKTWDTLPAEIQQQLDALALPHALWTARYADAHAREALTWSEQTYGVRYTNLSEEERRSAQEKVEPLLQDWMTKAEAKGFPAKKLLQQLTGQERP